jgi:hypothetical protein
MPFSPPKIRVKSSVLAPSVITCPDCLTADVHPFATSSTVESHQAGGSRYRWVYHVKHYTCTQDGYTWSENFG